MEIGTRVQFRRAFLRSTGQYTGPPAPTSYGPFAKGKITKAADDKKWPIVEITWDDGHMSRVLESNLSIVGKREP